MVVETDWKNYSAFMVETKSTSLQDLLEDYYKLDPNVLNEDQYFSEVARIISIAHSCGIVRRFMSEISFTEKD